MKAPVNKGSGGDYTPAPEGNQLGILVGIYNLGYQNYTYKGQEQKRNEVRLVFELPHAKKEFKEGEGEKPYLVAKSGKYSMAGLAFLRKTIEACIGASLSDDEAENFDVEDALGKPCLVNISHYTGTDGNTYAGIEGVSPIVQGMEVPKQTNENVCFDITDYKQEQYDALPEFLQKKVDFARDTFSADKAEEQGTPEIDPDEIPFN